MNIKELEKEIRKINPSPNVENVIKIINEELKKKK